MVENKTRVGGDLLKIDMYPPKPKPPKLIKDNKYITM